MFKYNKCKCNRFNKFIKFKIFGKFNKFNNLNKFYKFNIFKEYIKYSVIVIPFLKNFLHAFYHKLSHKLSLLLIAILTFTILFAGCNGKQSQEKGQAAERQSAETQRQPGNEGEASEQSDEIPEDLEKIEQDLEQIVKILNGPIATSEEEENAGKDKELEKSGGAGDSGSKQDDSSKEGEENQSEETGTKEEGNQENQDKENNNENEQQNGGVQENEQEDKDQDKKQGQEEDKDQQNKEGQQEGKDQQKHQKDAGIQQFDEKVPWQEVTPVINRLHLSWNSYEPKAAKSENSQDKLRNFSSALNELTNSIYSKNRNSALIKANKCYGEITKLYSIYKKPNVTEIKKLKYYTRNIMLGSMNNDWTQTIENMEQIKTVWDVLKSNLSENYKEDSDTLDFSIKELEKVIKEKNQNLVDLKGRIVLTNIESIDKKLKDDSQQKQQQS